MPQGAENVQRDAHPLHKYAAVQVLLAAGFSVLAAEPDMLLVDSPYQYLLPSRLVDLHVMSGAQSGDALGDGEDRSCKH